MKKLFILCALVGTTCLGFATPIKPVSPVTGKTSTITVNKLGIVTIHENFASCTVSGSIGIGANKISISATAATCKQALAMLKAVMQ